MPASITGFELPVFDDYTTPIVLTQPDASREARIARAASPHYVDTIIREVRYNAVGEMPIERLLFIADSLFASAAEACDAQVVDHTWGWYKKPYRYKPDYDTPEDEALLPKGYLLAAKVAALKSVRPLTTHQAQVVSSQFGVSSVQIAGCHWSDNSHYQFVNGIHPANGDRSIWLVDIEPMLQKTK